MGQQRDWRVWVVVLCVEFAIVYGEDVQNITTEYENGNSINNWDMLARGKKKKQKFILPLLMGMVLVKSFIIPLALKAMAIVSGKAIMLSALSLILASIVGFKKMNSNWDRIGQSLKDRGDAYFSYMHQPASMENLENYNGQGWSKHFRSK